MNVQSGAAPTQGTPGTGVRSSARNTRSPVGGWHRPRRRESIDSSRGIVVPNFWRRLPAGAEAAKMAAVGSS